MGYWLDLRLFRESGCQISIVTHTAIMIIFSPFSLWMFAAMTVHTDVDLNKIFKFEFVAKGQIKYYKYLKNSWAVSEIDEYLRLPGVSCAPGTFDLWPLMVQCNFGWLDTRAKFWSSTFSKYYTFSHKLFLTNILRLSTRWMFPYIVTWPKLFVGNYNLSSRTFGKVYVVLCN